MGHEVWGMRHDVWGMRDKYEQYSFRMPHASCRYVKFLSVRFRNSSVKSSISPRAPRRRCTNALYARSAGIAAKRPAAVLMSASLMPGATAVIGVDPVAPMLASEVMIPHTVAN